MNIFRPSKHDIYQIEKFATLGVNRNDIADILNISPSRLTIWEEGNSEIRSFLKSKARPEFTLLHPDYAHMVEEAFTCAGKRFFRFKEEFRMSTGRYKYYYATLREIELKVSLETLKKYIDAFKLVLNGGNKKTISIGDLWKLVINLESRLELAFDPTTVKELAAIAYFDDTEDLTTYNQKYGHEKIKVWEQHGTYDFFLTKPIGELFNVNSSSVESLVEYLNQANGIIQELNSNLQTVSEDNS